MINQNLQMNKFKDLLKSMSRRLDRIERYASQAGWVSETAVFDSTTGTARTWGNSVGYTTYTRQNKLFHIAYSFNLGTTFSEGVGNEYYIQLPWAPRAPGGLAGSHLYGYYYAVKRSGVGAGHRFGPVITDSLVWDWFRMVDTATGNNLGAGVPWVWDGNCELFVYATGQVESGY